MSEIRTYIVQPVSGVDSYLSGTTVDGNVLYYNLANNPSAFTTNFSASTLITEAPSDGIYYARKDGGWINGLVLTADTSYVDESKLASQYKGSSTISAVDIDWSASFAYTKTLTGNTTFTFSNLYVGIKTLIIDGAFTIGFPSGFTFTTGSEAYDGSKLNLIEVICWDIITPTGLINITFSA